MGMDPVTLALISSALVEGGSQVYGAVSNNKTNNANLNAALAQSGMIKGYADQMMQRGTSPFAQSIMNFIGQGQVLGTNANSFQPYNTKPTSFPILAPTGGNAPGNVPPYSPSDPNGDNPSAFSLVPSGSPSFPNGMASAQATAGGGGGGGGGSSLNPTIPGYTGGFTPLYSTIGGVDVSKYLGQGLKMGDLVNMGVLTKDQVYKQFNYNPATDTPGYGDTLLTNDVDALAPNNQNALLAALNVPSVNTSGASGQVGPTQYLQNGIYYNAQGNPIGTQGQNGMVPGVPAGTPSIDPTAPVTEPPVWNSPGLPPGWSSPVTPGGQGGYGSTGAGGVGSAGGMYVYQPQNAQTYAPATLGAPTLIGSSQGQNAGQDSLLQMMRSPLQPSTDPSISANLADISSGNTQFNNTDLFKALNTQAQQQLGQQVGQLHGSAGSLGERFGTAMNQNEALLRTGVQNALDVNNAQIAQTSFENAQNRRLQSLGLASTNLQNTNQFNLSAGGQAQQAASTYAGNQLQSQIANQNMTGQYALANQNALNTGKQFNAAAQATNNQFNASQGNQYNNLILQALGMAGNAQGQQNGQNAQLLGILAGLGVPQAQPNQIPGAVGDAASSIAMIPLLQSILGKGSTGYAPTTYNPTQSPYAQYGVNA